MARSIAWITFDAGRCNGTAGTRGPPLATARPGLIGHVADGRATERRVCLLFSAFRHLCTMSWVSWLRGALSYYIAYARCQYDALLLSGFPLFFWVKPAWSADQIGDLTGKVGLSNYVSD